MKQSNQNNNKTLRIAIIALIAVIAIIIIFVIADSSKNKTAEPTKGSLTDLEVSTEDENEISFDDFE